MKRRYLAKTIRTVTMTHVIALQWRTVFGDITADVDKKVLTIRK